MGIFLLFIYAQNADYDEYTANELYDCECLTHNENAGENRNHSCDIGK